MSNLTLTEYVLMEQAKLIKRMGEIDKTLELIKKFPNLANHVNRWEKVRLYTSHVNKIVDKFDMSHNCGCCSDSALELWPYVEIDGMKIYSSPPVFLIGEKCGSGDTPDVDWRKDLEEHNIPICIINEVTKYFEEHPSTSEYSD